MLWDIQSRNRSGCVVVYLGYVRKCLWLCQRALVKRRGLAPFEPIQAYVKRDHAVRLWHLTSDVALQVLNISLRFMSSVRIVASISVRAARTTSIPCQRPLLPKPRMVNSSPTPSVRAARTTSTPCQRPLLPKPRMVKLCLINMWIVEELGCFQ